MRGARRRVLAWLFIDADVIREAPSGADISTEYSCHVSGTALAPEGTAQPTA